MSRKWYGSISNRIEEGRNYNDDKLIHEGDDITMYYWSDCTCYYVTKVIDQKHIFVRKYHVIADKDKAGGMGHQDWLYFKTAREQAEYLNNWYAAHPEKVAEYKKIMGKYEPEDLDAIIEDKPEEWVFRYGHWRQATRFTKALAESQGWWRCRPANEKEQKIYDDGGELVHYNQLGGNVSFGVRSYYFDWQFWGGKNNASKI